MQSTSFPAVPVAVLVLVALTAPRWWAAASSVPLWCLWFGCAALLYPTYLLYVVKPLAPPSLSRSALILAPLLLLAALAVPARRAERWGFELCHLAVGAVVFSVKKCPEMCVGYVEPTVAQRGWGRFILHFLTPAHVAYEEAEPSDALCAQLRSLTPEQYHAAFRGVRRAAAVHCFWGALHLGCGALLGCASLWLVYHDAALLRWPGVSDVLRALMVLEVCCGLFPLVKALCKLLHGDGVWVGGMFEGVLLSTSISTFWRRWNRGMRDAFYHAIYAPLGGRRRLLLSSLVVGACSGALHEYEVWLHLGRSSTAMLRFFVLQVAAVAAERTWTQWAQRVAGGRWRMGAWAGWLLTAAWLCWSSRLFLQDFGLDLEEMAGKAVYPWMTALGWRWDDLESALRRLGGPGLSGHKGSASALHPIEAKLSPG